MEMPSHDLFVRTRTDSDQFTPFAHPLRPSATTYVLMGVLRKAGEPEQRADAGRTAKSSRRLHVARFDHKRGVPVDPRFRAAVDQIESIVFRYRSKELADPAEIANLAEQAVYRANWARYGLPCENPVAYVITIFRRDADQYLKRRSRFASIDERSHGYANVAGSTSADVERGVLVRELLDGMDDITRAILLRRVEGGESPGYRTCTWTVGQCGFHSVVKGACGTQEVGRWSR